MPRIVAGADFDCRMANPGRRLALGPAFQGDLEFWRWFVEGWTRAEEPRRLRCIIFLSAPVDVFWFRTHRNRCRGFWLETGVYLRYELDAGERSRFCGSSKSVADDNDMSTNVREQLDMVVSAWVLVSACDERPFAMGDSVLLRGDN